MQIHSCVDTKCICNVTTYTELWSQVRQLYLGAIVDNLIEEKEKKIRAVLYKVSEVKDELVAHHLDFEQKQADLTHKHENKLRIFNQGLKTMEKGY